MTVSKSDYDEGLREQSEDSPAQSGIEHGVESLNPFANDDYRKGLQDGFDGEYEPPED